MHKHYTTPVLFHRKNKQTKFYSEGYPLFFGITTLPLIFGPMHRAHT